MNLEFIYFTLNLSLFITVFYSLLNFNFDFEKKLSSFLFFSFYSTIFYFVFHYSYLYDLEIFKLKEYFFNFLATMIFLILFLFSTFLKKGIQARISKILFSLLITQVFFYFFGIEDFFWKEEKIPTLSLLKTQNIVIGISSLLILLIPNTKIQILSCLIILFNLFYFIFPNQKNMDLEENIYQKYIPNESFFGNDYFIFEEERGVYKIQKNQSDDVYYKLNLTPLKDFPPPIKQKAQFYIASFHFPVILYEEDRIVIHEIARSFRGNNFQIIIQRSNAKINYEGPIF